MDTVVRQADVVDVPALASLVLEVAPEVVAREPTFRHTPDRRRVERRYESRVRDTDRSVFVAVIDESVVGFIDAMLVRNSDAAASYHAPELDAYVDELIVTASAQRRGIGTSLIQAVEEWAVESGARLVTLDTHVLNEAARALYASLGYREFGVILGKEISRRP